MNSSLVQLQRWVSNSCAIGQAEFVGVSTDSRSVVQGNLFIALRGDNFDAHHYLAEVVAKGVAAVVVEELPVGIDIPALIVPNTRQALGEIAMHWRRQFTLPVIGVTGSNGKTTVKEMIASILQAAFDKEDAFSTRGNFNNDIGVPLTLLRMASNHRAAVIELGMNHPGEIALLSAIAQPTVGLVNNAQREHQEFMASVEAVAKENGAVIQSLPENGTAVFPADDQFTPLWTEFAKSAGQRKIMTFGLAVPADVTCTYAANDFGNDLLVVAGDRRFPVRLSAAGTHNVRNALAAIACAFAIGVSEDAVIQGLEAFAPVNGRLQRKTAANGALVIDDTYNANPDSVRAAIDVLAKLPAPRILVLGDMGEVGNEGQQFHEEIGNYACAHGVEQLFALGELVQYACNAFGSGAKHCANIENLVQELGAKVTPTANVLVKGSRFMQMDRVVRHLVGQNKQEDH